MLFKISIFYNRVTMYLKMHLIQTHFRLFTNANWNKICQTNEPTKRNSPVSIASTYQPTYASILRLLFCPPSYKSFIASSICKTVFHTIVGNKRSSPRKNPTTCVHFITIKKKKKNLLYYRETWSINVPELVYRVFWDFYFI